jgi:transcription-repair coupling factor (superfamily II helicase)
MKLSGLLELGEGLPSFKKLMAELRTRTAPAAPLGIIHSARPFVVALLANSLAQPLIVLTTRTSRARQWVDELRIWLPDEVPVHLFADPDALPYERIPWAPETRQRRLEALTSLAAIGLPGAITSVPPVVVTSVRALMQLTIPVRELRLALRTVRSGTAFDLNKMLLSWVALGYDNAAVVETPGQFSRRGGIVDVWPPNLRKPVRVELFGDEVESLRTFDPSTQRTVLQVEQALIGPASEALPRLGERVGDRLRELDLARCHPPARAELEREIEHLTAGTGFRNLEWFIPYLYRQPASLTDYLPESGWLVVDDAAEVLGNVADLVGQAEQSAHDLMAAGDVPGNMAQPYFPAEALKEKLVVTPAVLLGGTAWSGWASPDASELGRAFASGPRYGGQIRPAVAELQGVLRQGRRVVMVTRQAQRMVEIWLDAGHHIAAAENLPEPPAPGLTLVHGALEEGWRLEFAGDSADVWLLTDAELFGWGKPRPRRLQRPHAVAPEVFFADVSAGDFVVHMEHGIGRFVGLVKQSFEGVEREYLQVDYAQGDRLLVPVHQADRLSRYVGVGESEPALHRLGTSDWEQVKARTKRAVAEIADELLALYAAREVVSGHAFSPDAPWQAELEASFPYVETEDQLVAIEAVKHDMESPRPMDRLICGDVGYGKTEVALRAAFKAIMDSKQVAVLVPTTVLAQQHFTNFSRRLNSFPVRVAMLSRFQSTAQQQKTLEGLLSGQVDLVIGTHRLLSKDVTFKDLGLLIVDEEQRFGVAHKERIKKMRTEIDVLTLTATPIPRTLHMSLSGVRDLSTIETPPEERLPIKTIVADFDESLIRQAILRELDRNGQVYFVHNRVQGIEQWVARLQRIVPEVRIALAHGQMPEKELSSVMMAFSEGEFDVLVCTSIIESGLDIPNVNTILINRADQFGLAQLYQLRGRVGRSAIRAYAYLLVDKFKTLTQDARRRLEAIQEASDLGAGFRVAMHDLEIRGAGDLLGARQHGNIASVGFDLYTRLLAQAVQEARERQAQTGRLELAGADNDDKDGRHNLLEEPLAPAVTLDLNLPASIPDSYVPEATLRLQLYRRLAGLTTMESIDEIMQEFNDRFGPPPEEVTNLLYVVRIKVRAALVGVTSIGQEDGQLLLRCDRMDTLERSPLQRALTAAGLPARVSRRAIWLPMREGKWRDDLAFSLDKMLELLGTAWGKGG